MSRPDPRPHESDARRDELLAERAVFGLDAGAQVELLEHGGPEGDDALAYERIAAAVALEALDLDDEPALPAALARRAVDAMAAAAAGPAVVARVDETAAAPPRVARLPWITAGLGWAVAVAACVALLLGPAVMTTPGVQAPDDAASRRARLVANATDLDTMRWRSTDDPAALASGVPVTGDVIWSPAANAGFASVCHLAVNEPGTETYQLWLFDPARPDEAPVLAARFDVPAESVHETLVIELDPVLPVGRPTRAIITVEPAGGSMTPTMGRTALRAALRDGAT